METWGEGEGSERGGRDVGKEEISCSINGPKHKGTAPTCCISCVLFGNCNSQAYLMRSQGFAGAALAQEHWACIQWKVREGTSSLHRVISQHVEFIQSVTSHVCHTRCVLRCSAQVAGQPNQSMRGCNQRQRWTMLYSQPF